MVPVLFGRFFGFPAAFGGRAGKSTFGWACSRMGRVRDDNAIGTGSIPKMAVLAFLDPSGSVEPVSGIVTPTGTSTKS
jgi:hypothetical protein